MGDLRGMSSWAPTSVLSGKNRSLGMGQSLASRHRHGITINQRGSGGVRNVLRSMVGRGEGHASAYPAQPKTQTDLLDLGEAGGNYYMMDVLKLDGATMGRLQTAAKVPWDIKPVLGMCSDALPLWGFHRTSYLVSACVFSSFLYLWVGFNAALGGMAASSIKGYLVAVLGSRGTMMSNVFCAVAVFIPAIRRWLPEEQLLSGHCTPKLSQFRRNSSITAVAIFLSVVAVGLSLSQIFLQEWRTRALVTLFCCIVVTISAYKAMRKISPFLANTGMLLFWRAVLQPGLGEAMFVWMSKDEEGPRFSPQLMGLADCFGQAGFLLGVVVYNRFLRTWKYRRIFLVGQIMVVASQVLDFILVMRWNQALGIPDVLFFLGDSTFDHAVAKTFYVPLVVLAYKVCPSNLEGTIFSTLISLNNIGRFLCVVVDQKQSTGGFWQGVRGGLKHVGNALNHAGKLNQVDHPLSAGGLAQARQLRQQIAALASDSQPSQALRSSYRSRR
eukprot:g27894.t1